MKINNRVKISIILISLISGIVYWTWEKEQPEFYYHLVADVEFDGEHLVYDEYILCEAFLIKRPGQANNRGYRVSSVAMGKRLDKGGGLFLVPPQACGEGNRVWNENQEKDNSTEIDMQSSFSKIELPDNILPFFYWSDDADRPTILEGYNSESYFDQSYSRLKINKVFIGDYTLTLPEGAVFHDDQVTLPDPMSPSFVKAKNSIFSNQEREFYSSTTGFGWRSYSLHPIFEEEWRTSPPYVEFINQLKGSNEIVVIPRPIYAEGEKQITRGDLSDPSHKVFSSLSAKRANFPIIREFGIPRLKGYPNKDQIYPGHQLGLVSKGASIEISRIPGLKRIDETYSLQCDVTFCELKEPLLGVEYFYKNTRKPGENYVRTIKYDEKEIPITNVNQSVFTVFYDPKTKIIWVFESSGI